MTTKQTSRFKSKAERLFSLYDERLKDIHRIKIDNLSLEEMMDLYKGFEQEIKTLESKKSSILSEEMRASLKNRYLILMQQYRDIVRIKQILKELERMFVERNFDFHTREDIINSQQILPILSREFDRINSSVDFQESLKQNFRVRFNSQIQRISTHYINHILPVEFRDSINLIERTLQEPKLFALPHLIMWRETAEKKIEILQNRINPKIPQTIEDIIVNMYTNLIRQLKAEILKLRTYPIPEPWCSDCMRKGLTHLIQGEFIFFVHKNILEGMKSLNLSERDILPGGITQEEYDCRLNRLNMESASAIQNLENTNAKNLESKILYLGELYNMIAEDVQFAFKELSLLYKDGRTLEYLVNKNEDDKLLKEFCDILLRNIRHYYNNRIDIPSFVVDYQNNIIRVAPPKEERRLTTASGIDRGGSEVYQLVTPAAVTVVDDAVIVADRYGHLISIYRAYDLAPTAWYHEDRLDTPSSMTVHQDMLYVCYSDNLVQFNLSLENTTHISLHNSISIEQACCITSNISGLYVGTLEPSIILMDPDALSIRREYILHPIRYHTKKRYPWLQDMKALRDMIICLFTGSPSPLQMFSLEGELIRSILTEDQIAGAYHFALYINLVTRKLRIYITDFWDSSIKVFDLEGNFIESFCDKGFELGQIFHPTGIFIEDSGYITICDMKDDNCLQRL